MFQDTNFQEQVITRIDVLAEKLGVAAEQIWSAYLLEAKLICLDFVIMLVLTIPITLLAAWCIKKYSDCEYKKEDMWMGCCIATGGTALIGIIISVVLAFMALHAWVNPEYWAFSHIIAVVR